MIGVGDDATLRDLEGCVGRILGGGDRSVPATTSDGLLAGHVLTGCTND